MVVPTLGLHYDVNCVCKVVCDTKLDTSANVVLLQKINKLINNDKIFKLYIRKLR